MAAKIGILGESTTATAGEVTVYTVPADKAARIRVFFWANTSGSGTKDLCIRIGMPGTQMQFTRRNTADQQAIFTGVTFDSGVAKAADTAVIDAATATTLTQSTGERESAKMPLAVDWYLSTGDTVRYLISTGDFSEMFFQVIGVEDDA